MHIMYCLRTHKFHFSVTFSLKMGPTVLFTHLKIILLQYFSIFSFSFQFLTVSKRILILKGDSRVKDSVFFMCRTTASLGLKLTAMQNGLETQNPLQHKVGMRAQISLPHRMDLTAQKSITSRFELESPDSFISWVGLEAYDALP